MTTRLRFTAMRNGKLVRLYVVLADTDQSGPAGDGTVVFRFRTEAEANYFAMKNTCYGRPATVTQDEVPLRLAQRWGCA